MKSFFKITLLFLCISCLYACYYDVEEELYPAVVACDTTNVSFNQDVYPVINTNCNTSGCHNVASNQAGFTFEGYNNVKKNVTNPKFLGSIKHEKGFSTMPSGRAKLQNCDILKIEQWKNNGAPNN